MPVRGLIAACAVVVTLVLGGVVCGERPAKDAADADVETAIASWIALLDADEFEARERATIALRTRGQAALPALQEATRHPSLEVRTRARALVESITAAVWMQDFRNFAAQTDDRLSDEEGMWLIARILDPAVRKEDADRQLDALAARVKAELGDGPPALASPDSAVRAIQKVLFEEEGLGGNKGDYGNPDNSSLDRVLRTKKGLPILVSHVVVSVARRLEIPIVGVPASGRYIVKYDGSRAPSGFPPTDIFIDPYEGGRILSREDLRNMFPLQHPDKMLPLNNRGVLCRMLRNLISALAKQDESYKAEQARQLLELLQAYDTQSIIEP